MISKPAPHQWVHVPHFKTEIRNILNVRQRTLTVRLWEKKYFDIDTCTYILDKCEKIYAQSLCDIFLSKSDYYFISYYYPERLKYIYSNYDLDKTHYDLEQHPSLKYEWEF